MKENLKTIEDEGKIEIKNIILIVTQYFNFFFFLYVCQKNFYKYQCQVSKQIFFFSLVSFIKITTYEVENFLRKVARCYKTIIYVTYLQKI